MAESLDGSGDQENPGLQQLPQDPPEEEKAEDPPALKEEEKEYIDIEDEYSTAPVRDNKPATIEPVKEEGDDQQFMDM